MSVVSAGRRVRRLWREAHTDAEMHWQGYVSWRDRLKTLGVFPGPRLRVLEVGTGDRAQLALLFAADHATVTALDLAPVALGSRRPSMWTALLRTRGARVSTHAVARDILHTFRYWAHLGRLSGRRLPFRRVRLVQADAVRLPFPDASFDLVVSSAVWEHLPDVTAATREVRRVLAPGGTAIIQIALFPALQGGHHAEWHSADPTERRSIRPWDHLREGRRPFPTYLNEWREADYRQAVERIFPQTAWEDGEERGQQYLTDAQRAELSGFTERDLLMSGVTAWARRPHQS